ncbi:Predicted acyltransferase, contains DUF342 domain [Halorubrum xinjiangense]|uniref:Predicted acyltransferase, contains DUF342 domain n=1 Tax=Halorubrum xinjiangense TaxID=261291 RepID=A0A1G7ME84_9EURY|nr:polymer-forming cytoskeletal protein [Halorubrum xinjiangense]SDF60118.1 Predicted acyltransferase, contains DUF342 domain [Halorubrum xinjiangense]
MSLRGDGPIEELAIPSGTTVEEHDVVVDGDVLVGGQSTVKLGVRGRNVAVGERVRVANDIEAEGDCRLDTWCSVDGNVLVGEDAYLGERVTVTGRLMVSGDLDIGDDVTIEEGFEANGWIVIRNPVPTIVFYFIVLSQLLRVGETDAADELAEALADGDDVRDPLLIPRSAEISDDAWRVSTPATVGDDCRLHGNLRATSIRVGERNEVFGSLRAREDVTVGADTVIHGDVTTRGGTVTVEGGARVLGDVSAGDLVVYDGAEIQGTLRARGEMKLIQETEGAVDDADEADADEENEADADEENEADPDEANETDTDDVDAADIDSDDSDSEPDDEPVENESPADDDGEEVEADEEATTEEADDDEADKAEATAEEAAPMTADATSEDES